MAAQYHVYSWVLHQFTIHGELNRVLSLFQICYNSRARAGYNFYKHNEGAQINTLVNLTYANQVKDRKKRNVLSEFLPTRN